MGSSKVSPKPRSSPLEEAYVHMLIARSRSLALPLISHDTLLEEQKGSLPLDHVRFYSAELVLMLEYLRSKEIVHR